MPGENIALITRWFEEVWNKKRIAAIAEMASPDCIAHGQAQHDITLGLGQFEQFARTLQGAFPDLRVAIDFAFEQDDKVVARWTARMQHTGNFLGIAPSGRQAVVTGTTIVKIANGKIVEGWDNWDQLGLMVQIGAVDPVVFVPPLIEAKAS
jgi:steroid delta-isomerase-like uncharacterized protein